MKTWRVTAEDMTPGIPWAEAPDGRQAILLGTPFQANAQPHAPFDEHVFPETADQLVTNGQLYRVGEPDRVSGYLGSVVTHKDSGHDEPRNGLLVMIDTSDRPGMNVQIGRSGQPTLKASGFVDIHNPKGGKWLHVVHTLTNSSATLQSSMIAVTTPGGIGEREGYVVVNVGGGLHRVDMEQIDQCALPYRKRRAAAGAAKLLGQGGFDHAATWREVAGRSMWAIALDLARRERKPRDA